MRVLLLLATLGLCACPSHQHADAPPVAAKPKKHAAEPAFPPGADIKDLTLTGEAVPLVPVPGKLTVFDFWAPWCRPCKTLTPALYQLAAAHPDTLAIRRINVVDWDSPASARYIGDDQGIPHLKIYSPQGALLEERTGSPPILIQLVESFLVTPASPSPTVP